MTDELVTIPKSQLDLLNHIAKTSDALYWSTSPVWNPKAVKAHEKLGRLLMQLRKRGWWA